MVFAHYSCKVVRQLSEGTLRLCGKRFGFRCGYSYHTQQRIYLTLSLGFIQFATEYARHLTPQA